MSATDTLPAEQEILSVETLALMADMSALLATGEAIGTASVELLQLDGTPYAPGLVGNATVSGAGKLITQVVSGLVAGKTYRLVWIGTVASNKIIAAKTRIDVPL